MAKRDQISAFLGRLNTSDSRNGQNIAFLVSARLDQCQCRRLHADVRLGDRDPRCHLFLADVDHASVSCSVEMSQLIGFGHG